MLGGCLHLRAGDACMMSTLLLFGFLRERRASSVTRRDGASMDRNDAAMTLQ